MDEALGQKGISLYTPEEGKVIFECAKKQAQVFYEANKDDLPSLNFDDYLDAAFEFFENSKDKKVALGDIENSLNRVLRNFVKNEKQNLAANRKFVDIGTDTQNSFVVLENGKSAIAEAKRVVLSKMRGTTNYHDFDRVLSEFLDEPYEVVFKLDPHLNVHVIRLFFLAELCEVLSKTDPRFRLKLSYYYSKGASCDDLEAVLGTKFTELQHLVFYYINNFLIASKPAKALFHGRRGVEHNKATIAYYLEPMPTNKEITKYVNEQLSHEKGEQVSVTEQEVAYLMSLCE